MLCPCFASQLKTREPLPVTSLLRRREWASMTHLVLAFADLATDTPPQLPTLRLAADYGIMTRAATEAGRAAVASVTSPHVWIDTSIDKAKLEHYRRKGVTTQALTPQEQRRLQGLEIEVDWSNTPRDKVAVRLRLLGDRLTSGTELASLPPAARWLSTPAPAHCCPPTPCSCR